MKKKNLLFSLCSISLLGLAFVFGIACGYVKNTIFPNAIPTSTEGNWGLSFQEDGKPPVANASFEELEQFDAYYAKNTTEKLLYLTFDAGYENGNTSKILDTLKKHQVPATFFVVGPYVKEHPELIKRMDDEHHLVGNHTYHHKDMSALSDASTFAEELTSVSSLYEELVGKPMEKFYRPPQGKYNESNLKLAQDLGYKTFFWSLAYVDWYENDQPNRDAALDKLLSRIHPGAIILLHSTSSTNAEILDEFITKCEDQGYEFRSLKDF